MPLKTIDLNSDVGESFGNYTLGLDEEVIPLISSANIACGYHAGDPAVMRQTVALALNQRRRRWGRTRGCRIWSASAAGTWT